MGDDSDLYDDILCQQDTENNHQSGDIDISDLYENIHNPQVAETALEKVETLTSENNKLKSQNSKLKEQITILQNLNSQLTTTNSNLENNIKQLIETARTEINRKNTEIIDRQSKLEDVLFRRAARSLTSRELEAIMEKFSLRHREESLQRLPTNLERRKVASQNNPDLSNVANRQFVRKKRTISSEENSKIKRIKLDEKSTEKVKENEESCAVSREPEKTLNTDISLISNYVKGKERRKKLQERPKVEVPSQSDQVTEVGDQRKKKTEDQPLHARDESCLPPVDDEDDKENDETEGSAIIRIPVVTESSNGDGNTNKDTASDREFGEDILEIDTTERFDDEESREGHNVYFKSLETNFNIPKVSSSDRKDPDHGRRREKEKKRKSSATRDTRRERKSRGESSSGDRNRSLGRGRSTSRSRKPKPRSGSKPRRSRSRQRRGRGRGREGKPMDQKRKTSREREMGRGREREKEDRKRRRSSSRRRRRWTRSCSGEKRKRSGKMRSPDRRTRQARRSQSLSPSRLEEEVEVDIDQVEIKEDLSLAELKKIKEEIKGKMGLNDDLEPVTTQCQQPEMEVEDGEVLSEEEEEKKDDWNRKIQDLRQKLSKDSNSPVVLRNKAEVLVDNR